MIILFIYIYIFYSLTYINRKIDFLKLIMIFKYYNKIDIII